jgi:hypothetical protein
MIEIMSNWEVGYTKKALKMLRNCPENVQKVMRLLDHDIRMKGPVRGDWDNYGWLHQTQEYHCHLTYRYVACWRANEKEKKVEVTYVGTRENAPYGR